MIVWGNDKKGIVRRKKEYEHQYGDPAGHVD
jgi:hypothetical protein